jgi:glycosyltransferase involved in cell wall biosynthesis
MRLNWFSPLPPERTDIAHYTARIAPALQRQFDVVYWTSTEGPVESLPQGAEVQVYDPETIATPAMRKKLFEGLNLYNMGNDVRFHGAIYRTLNTIPGVVILHDTKLHHFTRGFHRSNSDYVAIARKHYGEAGATRATEIIAGRQSIDQHVDAMPFTEAVLAKALGAICHTKIARTEIAARSNLPILDLPLPFRSLAKDPGDERIWAPPYRLIMFGYIGSNRRLDAILHALADVPNKRLYRFDIYGTLADKDRFRAVIADRGLQDLVRIHGFVSESELDQAIASSHLAFNLRFPTVGEASGGILRSWNRATPALVTDLGSYKDLPDEVAHKISLNTERADILAALAALVENPASFKRRGLAAQTHARKKHDPETYVADLKAALEDAEQLQLRYAAHAMSLSAAAHSTSRGERKILLDCAATRIASVFGR